MAKRKEGNNTKPGNKATVIAIRITLLWVIPPASFFVGTSLDCLAVVTVLAAVLTALELALFYKLRTLICKGKSKGWGGWFLRFFPLRLLGLYLLQAWWLMMHAAASPEAADTLDLEQLEQAAPSDDSPLPVANASGLHVADPGVLHSAVPVANASGFHVANGSGASRAGVFGTNASNASGGEGAAPPAGGGFQLDAPPESLRWSPKTISVVLPCAEEREYAVKTIKSVFDATPSELLHEIIVVDDGSEPPLEHVYLRKSIQERYKVNLLRNNKTVGLIGAKKKGGDAATGDIVVFFDCHVAPQPHWHKDFLDLIGENYRRMVVPQITALNVDSWTQIGSGGGLAKCYLTWDADFKWFTSADNYIAVISGGLLGMSRRWWRETGGYDEEMLGWGGENLDQSLRVWLCGGEIVMAPHSEVAHMWRDGSAKTRVRYKRVGDTNRNRARAVYAWYGEFADKLLDYPNFASRLPLNGKGGTPWYGNLDSFQKVRDRLQGCRPFAWFLHRFKKVYEDAGFLPASVFMLQESQSGECLFFDGQAGTSGNGLGTTSLAPCDEKNHRFFWHTGNMDRHSGQCCSGLHAWNTDQCLTNGRNTGVCEVSGRDSTQYWSLQPDGRLKRRSSCLEPGKDPGTVAERPCSALRSAKVTWKMVAAYEPLETRLYKKAMREHPNLFQASKP